jgi:hypothetical protein
MCVCVCVFYDSTFWCQNTHTIYVCIHVTILTVDIAQIHVDCTRVWHFRQSFLQKSLGFPWLAHLHICARYVHSQCGFLFQESRKEFDCALRAKQVLEIVAHAHCQQIVAVLLEGLVGRIAEAFAWYICVCVRSYVCVCLFVCIARLSFEGCRGSVDDIDSECMCRMRRHTLWGAAKKLINLQDL